MLLLFAPTITTTAMPTAIAASSGSARLMTKLRARIAARMSRPRLPDRA
jgi:hypothetical protein